MYKDNPNNRRLNRVGKPLGSVKDPAKKTLTSTEKGKTIKYKLPKDEEKLKKLQEETKKLKSMVSNRPKTLGKIPKDAEKLKKLQEEIKELKRMVRIKERPGDKPLGELGSRDISYLKNKYLKVKNRLEKNGTLSLKDQTLKRQLEILIENRQKDNWLSKNKF